MEQKTITQRDTRLIVILVTLAIVVFALSATAVNGWFRLCLLFGLICNFIIAPLGSTRRIGYLGAFLISILVSPVFGLIFIFNSTKLEDDEYQEKMLEIADQKTSDSTIADQLYKLNELRKEGVLTYQEFELQKDRILNS